MGKNKKKKALSKEKAARERALLEKRRSAGHTAYNRKLWQSRRQAGLGRLKFAGALGISPFVYPLLESGYLKPTRRQTELISSYLQEDYQLYCTGLSSYPEELPEKTRGPVATWFFNLLGNLYFRLFLVLLIIICLGLLAYGIKQDEERDLTWARQYPTAMKELRKALLEEGSFTFSGYAELKKEVARREDNKLITIKTALREDAYDSLECVIYYWTETSRITYQRNFERGSSSLLEIHLTDYRSNDSYSGLAMDSGNGSYALMPSLLIKNRQITTSEAPPEILSAISSHLNTFNRDIDNTIKELLGLDLDHAELADQVYLVRSREEKSTLLYGGAIVTGSLLGLVFLFCLFYSLIYGTKKGVGKHFLTGSNMMDHFRQTSLKTDLRFTPFLPETFLSITGSLLLLFSSGRFVNLALSFTASPLMDISESLIFNRNMMQIFYIAMFLLYFIDFDTFLDDKRVLGRIVMYFLLYIGLYAVETVLVLTLAESPSLLFRALSQLRLPNMFGSICCYYIIMYFLYFTPKYINTRKRLLFHRLCSLLPVFVIFGSKLVFNGGEKYFGWKLPVAVKYLFNGERTTFSLLCIGYLFGTFLLRYYFEKRLGTESALRYFNGNRFLWLKNGLTCGLILIISLINWLCRNNSVAASFGLEESRDLVLLIPLILFYHPHKGPRNRFIDAFTMAVYFFALSFGYIRGGLILLGELLGIT